MQQLSKQEKQIRIRDKSNRQEKNNKSNLGKNINMHNFRMNQMVLCKQDKKNALTSVYDPVPFRHNTNIWDTNHSTKAEQDNVTVA